MFLKALSTPTFVEISRLRGLPEVKLAPLTHQWVHIEIEHRFHFPHFDAVKIVDKQTDGANTLPIIRHLMNLPKGYNSGFNGVSSILGSHDQIGCRKVRCCATYTSTRAPHARSFPLLGLGSSPAGAQPC